MIQEAVGNLECGKSAGPDGIFAESIKFAHHRIHVLLSLCFSLCLTHAYMPLDMIKTTIVPVIKNKCGNLADSNNYRPIAIATIVSKLYESTIVYKGEDFLKTCDNQFGFKREHSTEFCIYTLKEFIDYYKQRGITIFVTFLDASKAFDKIDFCYYFKNKLQKIFLYLSLKFLLIGTAIKKCMFDGVQLLLLLFMYQMVLSKVIFYPQCFLMFIWTS